MWGGSFWYVWKLDGWLYCCKIFLKKDKVLHHHQIWSVWHLCCSETSLIKLTRIDHLTHCAKRAFILPRVLLFIHSVQIWLCIFLPTSTHDLLAQWCSGSRAFVRQSSLLARHRGTRLPLCARAQATVEETGLCVDFVRLTLLSGWGTKLAQPLSLCWEYLVGSLP